MITSNWSEVIEYIQHNGCSNFAQCHFLVHLNFPELASKVNNRNMTHSYIGILLKGNCPSILVRNHERGDIVEIPMVRNAEITRIGDVFMIMSDIVYTFKAG